MKKNTFTLVASFAFFAALQPTMAQQLTQPAGLSTFAAPTPTPPQKPREKVPLEALVPTLKLEGFAGLAKTSDLYVVPVGINFELEQQFVDGDGDLTVFIPKLYLTQIETAVGVSTKASIPLIEVAARFAYLAYRVQSLKYNAEDIPTGYRFSISSMSGVDFQRQPGVDAGTTDFFANVNLFGPRAEIEGVLNGHSFKLTMGLSLDYAVLSSFAMSPYLDENYDGAPENIGRKNRYQGLGNNRFLQFQYGGKVFSVGAKTRVGEYNSTHVSNDDLRTALAGAKLHDTRISQKLWIEIFPKRNWGVELGGELFTFKGQVKPQFEVKNTNNRLYLKIKYRL